MCHFFIKALSSKYPIKISFLLIGVICFWVKNNNWTKTAQTGNVVYQSQTQGDNLTMNQGVESKNEKEKGN